MNTFQKDGWSVLSWMSVPMFLVLGFFSVFAQESNPDRRQDRTMPERNYANPPVADAAFRRAVNTTKNSLLQAISAAESHTKGKAFEARFMKNTHPFGSIDGMPSTGTGNSSTNGSGSSSTSGTPGSSNDTGNIDRQTDMTNAKLVVDVCTLVGEKEWIVRVDENGKVINSQEKKKPLNNEGIDNRDERR